MSGLGERLPQLVTAGTAVYAAGLAMLGLSSVLAPGAAADGYGIALEGTATAWLAATGLRDFVLGLVLVALLSKGRAALRWVLPATLPLPAGDVAVVLMAGGSLGDASAHLLGVLAVGALTGLAWLEPRR